MYNLPILLAYFSLFVLGSVDNLRGPLYPTILETLSIDSIQGSWIFSLTSLMSLIFSLMAPLWMRRLSPQKALKISLFIQVLTLVLMGYSFSLNSYSLILLSSITLGIAMGIQGICVNTVLSIESNFENSRRLFSGLHAMYGLASLTIPLIVSYFSKQNISYELMLYILAFITFIPSLLFTYKVREKKKVLLSNFKFDFQNKTLLILSMTICLYVNTEILVSSRLVYFLKTSGGLTIEASSFYLSLFFVGLLIGRVFFSFIKVELNSLTLLKSSIYTSLVIYTAGMFLKAQLLFLIGLSSSFFFPCFMDFIKKNINNPDDTITKVMVLVSLSLAIMHSLFGQLSSLLGVDAAMSLNFLFYPLILYFLHFKVDALKRIS